MEIHLALKISEKNFRKIFQKKSPKNFRIEQKFSKTTKNLASEKC